MDWGTQLMFQDTGAQCFHTHHPELQICQHQWASLTFFASFQTPHYLSRPAQQSPHTLHTWQPRVKPSQAQKDWRSGWEVVLCMLFLQLPCLNTNSSSCQYKGRGCVICNLTFMNNSAAVCAAKCWEARKINWFCHEYPRGLFVSNAEWGSSRIPQDGCTEEGRTSAQNIAVQVKVANVECVFAVVTVWWTNRVRSWQRQLQGSSLVCGRQQGPVCCLIYPQIPAMW